MTVSYTAEVATCKGFGCFLKLLFRWRGSIYKLVWPDLFLFLGTYFSLSVLYRFYLSHDQQIVFEKITRYCEKYGNLIPVSFVLGFYVSIVVGRWWSQYQAIPWPDSTAVFVSANIHGQDEKARIMRRTIMRYCCLASTMCFTLISPRVKKRFPTLEHFVEAGLLMENEKLIIDALNQKHSHPKHWLPVVWACSIVTRARKEGKIRDDFAVKTILDELNKFRGNMGSLTQYDWISVPLVYTQVVTLAVYSFFLSCVMGRQWIKPDLESCSDPTKCSGEIDLVFPIFTTLQFFFYMGWLKVAESLVNPFGNDDDDFELNWMIDRNLQVSYLIVDEMHHEHPELLKDQYWDTVLPAELPHTVASEAYKEEPPSHSTANLIVSYQDGEIVSPPSVKSIHQMSESGEPGRRISMTPSSKFGGSFLRRGRTGSVRSTASQSTIGGESVGGRMSHAGSVTSVFRRLFSKDRGDRIDPQSPGVQDPSGGGSGPFNWAGSSINMLNRNVAEDVIPELDENLTTIISMREREQKPTVHDIFGTNVSNAPPASAPIDVPGHGQEPPPPRPLFMRSVTEPGGNIGERPSHLTLSTASVPGTTTRPKFELFPVTPDEDDGDGVGVTETTTTTLPSSSSTVPEPAGASTRPEPDISLLETKDKDHDHGDGDEDDEIQQGKRRSLSSDSLAKKLAKTFGRKEKSLSGGGDEKAEVHLLSDVSGIKDEDNSSP